MAYHHDLLIQAGDLVDKNEPTQAFVQLQDKRHIADYHNGKNWTHVESLGEVSTARRAFQLWASIRSQDIAQEYLVSLLIKARD